MKVMFVSPPFVDSHGALSPQVKEVVTSLVQSAYQVCEIEDGIFRLINNGHDILYYAIRSSRTDMGSSLQNYWKYIVPIEHVESYLKLGGVFAVPSVERARYWKRNHGDV